MRKRVYAGAQQAAKKRKVRPLSIKKNLLKLKESKRRCADTSGAGIAAGGAYLDVCQWNTTGYDDPSADMGYLVGVRIKLLLTETAAVGNIVRMVLLKSKQVDDITSGSYLFLDCDTNLGTPGRPSTEVLAAEQIVFPINKDGFVVRHDSSHVTSATAAGPSNTCYEIYVPLYNEKFELPRAAVEQATGHYYVALFGIENDNTASTVNYYVSTELIYKDGV